MKNTFFDVMTIADAIEHGVLPDPPSQDGHSRKFWKRLWRLMTETAVETDESPTEWLERQIADAAVYEAFGCPTGPIITLR